MDERMSILYDIVMQTTIGPRYGMMAVQIDCGKMEGLLKILNASNPFAGEIQENGDCRIRGRILTLMRSIDYCGMGNLSPEQVRLTLTGGRETFEITGAVRAGAAAEKKRRSRLEKILSIRGEQSECDSDPVSHADGTELSGKGPDQS